MSEETHPALTTLLANHLAEALAALVKCNEEHNAALAAIMGEPPGWKDSYLTDARGALAAWYANTPQPVKKGCQCTPDTWRDGKIGKLCQTYSGDGEEYCQTCEHSFDCHLTAQPKHAHD